jgi:hypothetical protein
MLLFRHPYSIPKMSSAHANGRDVTARRVCQAAISPQADLVNRIYKDENINSVCRDDVHKLSNSEHISGLLVYYSQLHFLPMLIFLQ